MRPRAFGTLLVGRSSLIRDGLARILSAAGFKVVSSAERVEDLKFEPGSSCLLVLDTWASDGEAAEIGAFKERCPGGRAVIIADDRAADRMTAAFRAGANAYFLRAIRAEAFIKGLELIMLGETILPSEMLPVPQSSPTSQGVLSDFAVHEHKAHVSVTPSRITAMPGATVLTRWASPSLVPSRNAVNVAGQPDSLAQLSVQQRCIVRLMAEGYSNKIIARKMNISDQTVKVHVKAILRKIGVCNRTQAAIWALNNVQAIENSEKVVPIRAVGMREGTGS